MRILAQVLEPRMDAIGLLGDVMVAGRPRRMTLGYSRFIWAFGADICFLGWLTSVLVLGGCRLHQAVTFA